MSARSIVAIGARAPPASSQRVCAETGSARTAGPATHAVARSTTSQVSSRRSGSSGSGIARGNGMRSPACRSVVAASSSLASAPRRTKLWSPVTVTRRPSDVSTVQSSAGERWRVKAVMRAVVGSCVAGSIVTTNEAGPRPERPISVPHSSVSRGRLDIASSTTSPMGRTRHTRRPSSSSRPTRTGSPGGRLFPEPVTPRSTWPRTPRARPSASRSIACGWSPVGSNGATRRKSGTIQS